MPTESVQDYLKAIYVLQSYGHEVTTSRIAARLGVAAPSVSAMVKRLTADGLVGHDPYRPVHLTDAGEQAALAVVRRHRLVETYLHDALGLPWDEVHDEAEVLEHSVSERVVDAMDRALGHPARDPHGDPIPPKQGRHQEVRDEPLDTVPPGRRARIERVSDHDPAVLRHLATIGLVPGAAIDVMERGPRDGPLWVRSATGRRHALEDELVSAIFVSVLEP
jgi:DtxR family Mn-dependent transcriptional regulator